MEFCWDKFTKEQYEQVLKKFDSLDTGDCVGYVHVGDICIDLVTGSVDGNEEEGLVVNALSADYYVLHEDTGYGYTKEGDIPYDYADGHVLKLTGLSYEEFKAEAEKAFAAYITAYTGAYSLAEHAARPLVSNW